MSRLLLPGQKDAAVESEVVASADALPTARRRAAALSYGHAEVQRGQAPRVTAKGNGLVAEAIIARARAASVPVHESKELVALLMQLDLDSQIPPALYVAVAEVLAWVYRLENRSIEPLQDQQHDSPPASHAERPARQEQ